MKTFGSLFAGIGGFDLGLERAGMSCAWQVEIDPAARSVLAYHWPDVPTFADVRDCGAHNLAPVDVLTFGFPCQDLSVAGNRAGLAGKRSGLFYEATRIADELRPDMLVWENVPGLLSSGSGRDFLAVLTELERIGYCGAWTTLDAQWFGVAQRRQRIFGVFARCDIGAKLCAEILSLAARMPGHSEAGRAARADVARGVTASAGHGRSSPRSDGSDNLISTFQNTGHGWWNETPTAATIRTPDGGGSMEANLVAFDLAQITSNVNRTRAEPGLPTSTLNGSGQMHVCGAQSAAHGGPDDNSGQAGHIIAFDWQAGDDSKFTDEDRGRKWIARVGDYTGAIGSTRRDGVAGAFGVRRLTPRECERLQGFPGDWTAYGADGPQSDSARYRQLGNAVCVNVSAWLAQRIMESFL